MPSQPVSVFLGSVSGNIGMAVDRLARPAAAPNGLLVQIFHSADRRVAAETFS